jgi:glycosyltransferase involved in cell wall biosynthesis
LVGLSLIIPSFDRTDLAMRSVQSAQQQELTAFELLLVDNKADPRLRERVEEFNLSARVPVRYIPEPRLGLHNARHAGARAASGEVLVFTDDDATFHPHWLAAYQASFEEHPEMAAAGGPVLPVWESPPPGWLTALIAADARMFPALSLLDLGQRFQLGPRGFFFGVNMAIRRQTLFESGGFNPEIFGARWLGDGETGLNRKLWARDLLVGYVPEAIVYHSVPAQRMTVKYLCRRQANDGACDMYARFHECMPSSSGLVAAAVAIVRESARDWVAAPLFRGRTDARSLRVQMRAARGWSRLAFTLQLMVSRRLRALVMQREWL